VHNPEVWQLFVDSSKLILKAVQQLKGNIHPSLSIDHSVHKKETYENMDLLLKAISYSNMGGKDKETLKS